MGPDVTSIAERELTDSQYKASDPVNHPEHYTSGEFECFDVMKDVFGKEAFAQYCKLNAFKYLWRAHNKGKEIEDIRKAIVYLEKFCSTKQEK